MDRTIEILLIEDNPGDARLTMEALREARMSHQIHHLPDGVEALAFLRREGRFVHARRPDLILLDLNMPRKDGRAVLAEIKSDDRLRRIPVVVLTSSLAGEDIFQAYDLCANCYVPKPADPGQFVRVVRSIEDFWFSVVKLPTE